MPEADKVNALFAGIAGRYDRANRLISGGLDVAWRRALVRAVCAREPRVVVDLATGSGDVAIALAQALGAGASVTGMDFCPPMLDQAREKLGRHPGDLGVVFEPGDCLDLPLEDESVDALTIAFGLRNLEDRRRGLEEMRRVLRRPEGALFVLEFTQPAAWFRPVYYLYLRRVLPRLAGWATGRPEAYQYLAGSIEAFPTRSELAEEIRGAGFAEVGSTGLTFSTVAIHTAVP